MTGDTPSSGLVVLSFFVVCVFFLAYINYTLRCPHGGAHISPLPSSCHYSHHPNQSLTGLYFSLSCHPRPPAEPLPSSLSSPANRNTPSPLSSNPQDLHVRARRHRVANGRLAALRPTAPRHRVQPRRRDGVDRQQRVRAPRRGLGERARVEAERAHDVLCEGGELGGEQEHVGRHGHAPVLGVPVVQLGLPLGGRREERIEGLLLHQVRGEPREAVADVGGDLLVLGSLDVGRLSCGAVRPTDITWTWMDACMHHVHTYMYMDKQGTLFCFYLVAREVEEDVVSGDAHRHLVDGEDGRVGHAEHAARLPVALCLVCCVCCGL